MDITTQVLILLFSTLFAGQPKHPPPAPEKPIVTQQQPQQPTQEANQSKEKL